MALAPSRQIARRLRSARGLLTPTASVTMASVWQLVYMRRIGLTQISQETVMREATWTVPASMYYYIYQSTVHASFGQESIHFASFVVWKFFFISCNSCHQFNCTHCLSDNFKTLWHVETTQRTASVLNITAWRSPGSATPLQTAPSWTSARSWRRVAAAPAWRAPARVPPSVPPR